MCAPDIWRPGAAPRTIDGPMERFTAAGPTALLEREHEVQRLGAALRAASRGDGGIPEIADELAPDHCRSRRDPEVSTTDPPALRAVAVQKSSLGGVAALYSALVTLSVRPRATTRLRFCASVHA